MDNLTDVEREIERIIAVLKEQWPIAEIFVRGLRIEIAKLRARNEKLGRALSLASGALQAIEISPDDFNMIGLKSVIDEVIEALAGEGAAGE